MGYWLLAVGCWQIASNMMIPVLVKYADLPRNPQIRKVLRITADVFHASRSSCLFPMKAFEFDSRAVAPHVKVLSFAVLSVLYWDTPVLEPHYDLLDS